MIVLRFYTASTIYSYRTMCLMIGLILVVVNSGASYHGT